MLLQRVRRYIRSRDAQLAIRPQRPWWMRWAGRLLALVLCLGLILIGSRWLGGDLLAPMRLAGENQSLRLERTRLAAALQTTQQSLMLQDRAREEDRAARDSLAQELAALREENLHLKEDLASLRSLMAPGTGGAGLRMSGFRVRAGITPGEYRWHVLVAQGGRQAEDFHGRMRLRLDYGSGDLHDPLSSAAEAEKDGAQPLSFKYYEELEGSFRAPPGSRLHKVWAEVWRDGESQPAATQAFAMP